MERATTDSTILQLHVSSVLVRALIEVARQRGVAPEGLVGDAMRAQFSEPPGARVPLEEFQAVLARARALTSEPALGLHCGLWASESSFGLMSPLVGHAQTLRHALSLVAQFASLLSEATRIELSEQAGTARLSCKLHAAIGQSMTELIVAGLVRTLRSFGAARGEIYTVCFEHKRPAHHHAYTVAFNGAERFAHAFTGVEFSAQLLDRPHMHWQPSIQAVLLEQAECELDQLSRPLTYTERVRAYLSSRRKPQVPAMSSAAAELGLSTRSLRRRLQLEGTSYRELSQAMACVWACSMLRNADLTIQAIAHALGFDDAPSFHRAFSRWTGLTPLEFRAAESPPSVRAP